MLRMMLYGKFERVMIRVDNKLFSYKQHDSEVILEIIDSLNDCKTEEDCLRLKEKILIHNFATHYFEQESDEIDYLFKKYVYDLDFEKKEMRIYETVYNGGKSLLNKGKLKLILKGSFGDDLRIFDNGLGDDVVVNVKEEQVKENYIIIRDNAGFFYLVKDNTIINKTRSRDVVVDAVSKRL